MSEWKEVQLNEICDLIAGYAFKSKDFGNYPTKVLKIADINPPFVSSEKSSGVDLSNYDVDKLEKYIVKKGDYILAMTGATIGKMGRYVSDGHAYLNQRVLKFQPYQSIDSDFLYYVLCGRLFAKYIINHIDSESAQPNISAGTIGKYRFNLPNFETQQKIASILSSLDSKIENNRKICANLEAQAQALFKHWFIDFAPFKDGKFVESELGMIPEGWRVGTLEDLGKIICGKTPSKANKSYYGSDIPFIKIPDMHENVFILKSEDNLSIEGSNSQLNKMIPEFSIMVSCIATVGLVAMNVKPSHTNQQINTIVPFQSCYRYYVYENLKLRYKELLMLGSSGTTTYNVNTRTFSSLKVLVPELRVIEDFNNVIKSHFEKILNLYQESSRLSTLRDTLLPKLMSGAINV